MLAFSPAAALAVDATLPRWQQVETALEPIALQLHPEQGKVVLSNGLATLNVPDELGSLPPDQATIFLQGLYGYPGGVKTLGVIIPSTIPIGSDASWYALITYIPQGHVRDDNSTSINDGLLMAEMKKNNYEHNLKLSEEGYHGAKLIGWAETPHYDRQKHALYWGTEIVADGSKEHQLNYNFRYFGRDGTLLISLSARIEQLPMIEGYAGKLLALAEFIPPHRYEDFNVASDKISGTDIIDTITGHAPAQHKETNNLLLAQKKLYELIVAFLLLMAAILLWNTIYRRKK